VALARALVTQPMILLLDEPLSALDPFLRIRVRAELKRFQRELGISFIHVTHSQEEAMALADLIVVMNDGRIEQSGEPRAIFNAPRTEFVARFIGGHNVMPIDGRTVAIRIDRLNVVPEPAAGDGARATVADVEYQGVSIVVSLKTRRSGGRSPRIAPRGSSWVAPEWPISPPTCRRASACRWWKVSAPPSSSSSCSPHSVSGRRRSAPGRRRWRRHGPAPMLNSGAPPAADQSVAAGLSLTPHDQRDRSAAVRPLVLGAAGHEQFRMADETGEGATGEGAGVAGGTDVGIVEHGVAVAAEHTGRPGLSLGKKGDQPLALPSWQLSGCLETEPGKGRAHRLDIDSIGHDRMIDRQGPDHSSLMPSTMIS